MSHDGSGLSLSGDGSAFPLGLRAQLGWGTKEALTEQLLDEMNTVCMTARVGRQRGESALCPKTQL